MIRPAMPRRALSLVLAAGAAAALAACGSKGIDEQIASQPENIQNGARLFVERCAGCHTFSVVGAEGGALEVHDRERVDGPNLDVRKVDLQSALYALRNGGFSGAIMPQNLVVGKEADDVAAFVAKYAGRGENEAVPLETPEDGEGSQPPASQSEGG
jgi:mono/diheme cytochrome c family protein